MKDVRRDRKRETTPAQKLYRTERRLEWCSERLHVLHREQDRLHELALELRTRMTLEDALEYQTIAAMERAAR